MEKRMTKFIQKVVPSVSLINTSFSLFLPSFLVHIPKSCHSQSSPAFVNQSYEAIIT